MPDRRSRAIVVGAGIAGVACARELVTAGITVSIRERASSIGGRMASPRIEGRYVDLGASYFTAQDPDFAAQVEDWCTRGLARRWTNRFATLTAAGFGEPSEGPWRYATKAGLRSLVADLAEGATAPLKPVLSSPVSVIEAEPSVDGEAADAVVLAMPDPQVKRILDPGLTELQAVIANRPWSASLALFAIYRHRSWAPFDGAFVNDDPTLSWIADDGARRGDGAHVLVAHSTPDFATRHLSHPQEATSAMVAAADRLLGCGQPSLAKVHRWTFAKPVNSRDEPFYFGRDRIGLAGDGWGAARVETAWLSGRALGRHIASELLG
jgi:renalase